MPLISRLVPLWRKALMLWRTLAVRVCMMGALALLALALTQVVEPLLPTEVRDRVSVASADRLLVIMANAMLAATIFSLTVMVSVNRSAASQWTPRVHRLIMNDPTTLNTLATFIGAYVYALTAIVLQEVGLFSDQGGLVLFSLTVAVMVLVVFMLIRWTLHLTTYGSLTDTAHQVEQITTQKLAARLRQPCMGARALHEAPPDEARAVASKQSGYVCTLHPEALDAAAEEAGAEVWLIAPPGTFVHLGEPLARVRGGDEAMEDAVRRNIDFGDVRIYDQDPRLGLIVLGEIGSKALSPGVNDPGTAIDMIARLARILGEWRTELGDGSTSEPIYRNLYLPPLSPADLLEDGYNAMARDGAGLIEVQERLQKVLRGLMTHPDDSLARAARAQAALAYARSRSVMDFEHDRKRLRHAADDAVVRAVEGAETGPGPGPS
ncbi:DUF2254 domain-containing protein [Roseisalinus antarcticus]|uniref:DUF2254 domain-containing protein n=1 Tax=Roseisalinus antarcticus TaxID=254357 RepID=A0A1Y5TBZ2_9RHOB|nr:DUF2254 domain-containing protein [Roseisalinus antarcticus]SLN60177.1 hypothetical protein ROA7023_02783 [Roseisalinus antarcticus]